MQGFTAYYAALEKHMKITKTPKLPWNEKFVSFFTEYAILQWKIIKRSSSGESVFPTSQRHVVRHLQSPSKHQQQQQPPSPQKQQQRQQQRRVPIKPTSGKHAHSFVLSKTVPSAHNRTMHRRTDGGSTHKIPPTSNKTTVRSVAASNNAPSTNTTAIIKKKKPTEKSVGFLGLCLALLYIMRVRCLRFKKYVVVPYCKYVAANAPQIKDLEEYDVRYQCRLITRTTNLIVASYEEMKEKPSLSSEDIRRLELLAAACANLDDDDDDDDDEGRGGGRDYNTESNCDESEDTL